MQFVVAPASSQVCRVAVKALLDHSSAPTVVGLYRDTSKAPAEFQSHKNFKAVRADLMDASTLDFTGSDGVLVMTPPKLDGSDFMANAWNIASNVREAVKQSGSIKRLVYVSSMGAQYSDGVVSRLAAESIRIYISPLTPSTGRYQGESCERVNLPRDAAPVVVFVRKGYFMENWVDALSTIKSPSPHFYSTLSPLDYKMPMVSARDIGKTCAGELIHPGSFMTWPKIIEHHGPESYSARDVKEAFEQVTGKSIEVRLVEKGRLAHFFGQFLPVNIVEDFVEMTHSFLPGGLLEDDMKNMANAIRGEDTLVDSFSRMWNGT